MKKLQYHITDSHTSHVEVSRKYVREMPRALEILIKHGQDWLPLRPRKQCWTKMKTVASQTQTLWSSASQQSYGNAALGNGAKLFK